MCANTKSVNSEATEPFAPASDAAISMKHLDNAGQTLEMERAQGDLNGHNPLLGLAQNQVSDRQSCQV